ncbi:hypothetical protein SAMN05660733_07676 [Lentzea albidocapillata]|uniref:Uncharacterized protein n=1 Tax=Lentzea albidocapillata TaxID=40571 RepID=A0A1W2FQS2_9PSEU|nr:hypothetical protein SAMN05660733_07676 [Lentzea albidocapillata]
MGDVWGPTSVTVTRSAEGADEAVRCSFCGGVFSRPKESGLGHAAAVSSTLSAAGPGSSSARTWPSSTAANAEGVPCPPDAEVTTVEKANRWKRR